MAAEPLSGQPPTLPCCPSPRPPHTFWYNSKDLLERPQACLTQNQGLKLVAKESLIFNNYDCCDKTDNLPKMFLKQKPVKISFQNNPAII